MINVILKLILISVIMVLSACAQLQTKFKKNSSDVISTEQASKGEKNKHAVNTKDSTMYLIEDGVDAFAARLALLKLAEKTIDIQYYIWQSDLIGKLLFNEILTAADRGVRVRIMLDDVAVSEAAGDNLHALNQHENIDVRLFNPFTSRNFRYSDYLVSPVRINRRMHNKSFTVDNQFTIVGGRNIGIEYFSISEKNMFSDIDVFAVGKIIKNIEAQFDVYWNSKAVSPVTAFEYDAASEKSLELIRNELNVFAASVHKSKYNLDIQDSEMYKLIKTGAIYKAENSPVFTGDASLVFYDPDKDLVKTDDRIVFLKNVIKPYVDKVDETLEIISPYFVPGGKGVDYLVGLVKNGVKVRVITNSLSSTDGLKAQAGYSRRRYDMLKGGVELFELKPDDKTKTSKSSGSNKKVKIGLHTKTYIFDRKKIFIGSFNFDQNSENIDSEAGVFYDSPEMAERIAKTVFEEYINDAVYTVKIAKQAIDKGDVEIEKGDIYWLEMKNGKEKLYAMEPETGFWRRFGQGLFSIMPIE